MHGANSILIVIGNHAGGKHKKDGYMPMENMIPLEGDYKDGDKVTVQVEGTAMAGPGGTLHLMPEAVDGKPIASKEPMAEEEPEMMEESESPEAELEQGMGLEKGKTNKPKMPWQEEESGEY